MISTPVTPCRVCARPSPFAFSQRVIGHDVSYFDCPHCGYVQTEAPFWLEEAYNDPIDELDTGIMWRNGLNSSRVVLTLIALHSPEGRVLDHAGGHGILVRLLRDEGVEAHWDDKYCRNILARGFESDSEPYDLVTAFEVFEHLERPREELEAMLSRAPHTLISTELITSPQTPAPDWWYYGPEHGQHIGFFRERTLAYLAAQAKGYYATDGRSLHLFSKRPIPRSWKWLMRRPKIARLIVGRRIHSKVWSDFETLRRRKPP